MILFYLNILKGQKNFHILFVNIARVWIVFINSYLLYVSLNYFDDNKTKSKTELIMLIVLLLLLLHIIKLNNNKKEEI